jgi:hypothetical protein
VCLCTGYNGGRIRIYESFNFSKDDAEYLSDMFGMQQTQ